MNGKITAPSLVSPGLYCIKRHRVDPDTDSPSQPRRRPRQHTASASSPRTTITSYRSYLSLLPFEKVRLQPKAPTMQSGISGSYRLLPALPCLALLRRQAPLRLQHEHGHGQWREQHHLTLYTIYSLARAPECLCAIHIRHLRVLSPRDNHRRKPYAEIHDPLLRRRQLVLPLPFTIVLYP